MEHNSSFDSFELQFTQQAQGFYREAAKWATFLSIVGFIGTAFMVIAALFMFAMGSTFGSSMGDSPLAGMLSGGLLGGSYLFFAILNFFAAYYLFKFASKTKQAFANNDGAALTESFENLKSYYKFTGIFVIVIIALYILAIIGAIVVGVGAAATM
ncbi:hypothetical protein D3C87_129000 [compost metagenome]